MDIYYIFWIIIQKYCVYFVAQIVSVLVFGKSFSCLLCLFTYTYCCVWVCGCVGVGRGMGGVHPHPPDYRAGSCTPYHCSAPGKIWIQNSQCGFYWTLTILRHCKVEKLFIVTPLCLGLSVASSCSLAVMHPAQTQALHLGVPSLWAESAEQCLGL